MGKAIRKIGLIAGGGSLPFSVLKACEDGGLEVFIVALDGQADPLLTQGQSHIWVKLGQLGTVLKALRAHGVQDLVMIGSVRRPSMGELMPDLKAMEFLAGAGAKALSGDNDILVALRHFLEKEGLALHGAHKFAKNLLMPHGALGRVKPSKTQMDDIVRGANVTQSLGALDVGQAAIVQQGLVLAVEAIEGTDQLLQRACGLSRSGEKGVLVKTCKPQQDMDLDLPTAGLHTIEGAYKAGLGGIALHAGKSFLLDREAVIAYADNHKMFVIGIDIP